MPKVARISSTLTTWIPKSEPPEPRKITRREPLLAGAGGRGVVGGADAGLIVVVGTVGRGAGPRANGETAPGCESAIVPILAYRGPRSREESVSRQQIRQLGQRLGQSGAVPGERFAVHQMDPALPYRGHCGV